MCRGGGGKGERFVCSEVEVSLSLPCPHLVFNDKILCIHVCFDQQFMTSMQGVMCHCVF